MRKPWDYEEPLCAEVGVDIFFAIDSDDKQLVAHSTTYKEAKEICRKCPHQAECAEWGVANEVHGVWGGLTPSDRRHLRRGRALLPISSIS